MQLGIDRGVWARISGFMLCLTLVMAGWTLQSSAAVAQTGGCWSTPPAMEQGYPTWTAAPNMVIDPSKTYTAEIVTSEGTIVIDLDAASAPLTVNNFVCLSEAGYYNFTPFHRIIKDFMIQAGDPTGTGVGGPGYQFADELPTGTLPYTKGTIAMANAGPGTNGSQFFIVQKDQPAEFPPNYSIFGHVSSGIEVVDAIASAPVQANVRGEVSDPMALVGIVSVKILENGQDLVLTGTPVAASPVASTAGTPTPAPTVATTATETPAITEGADEDSNTTLWIALGAAALAAVGYGFWRGRGGSPKATTRGSGKPSGGAKPASGTTKTTTKPAAKPEAKSEESGTQQTARKAPTNPRQPKRRRPSQKG